MLLRPLMIKPIQPITEKHEQYGEVKLNKQHLKRDYPTDVLSFNIDEETPTGEYYIGDIIVNIDQAKRQCLEYGNKDFRKEIAELVEHGVLHLLGIHHKEDH